MQPKDGDSKDYLSTILFACIAIFEFFRIYRYVRAIMNEDEAKDYEMIIAEKDKIIRHQQRELDRQKKIIDELTK